MRDRVVSIYYRTARRLPSTTTSKHQTAQNQKLLLFQFQQTANNKKYILTLPHKQEPFFVTAKFWKRFSVYASVILSVASLVISSIASLKPTTAADMKGPSLFLSLFSPPPPFFPSPVNPTNHSSSSNSNQHNHQRTLGHTFRTHVSRLAKPSDDGSPIRTDAEPDKSCARWEGGGEDCGSGTREGERGGGEDDGGERNEYGDWESVVRFDRGLRCE